MAPADGLILDVTMRLRRRIRRRMLGPVTGVMTVRTLRVLTVLGLVCLPSVADDNRTTLE